MASGLAKIREIIAEGKARRDSEAQQRSEPNPQGLIRFAEQPKIQGPAQRIERPSFAPTEPEPQPIQGPSRQIERPSFARPRAQSEVGHASWDYPPYTGTDVIHGRTNPVYTEEDSTRFERESNTVTLLDDNPSVDPVRPRQPDGTVPKPYTMPQVTPVSNIKNRVALNNYYSREGADTLYHTPTQLRFDQPEGGHEAGGYYRHRDAFPFAPMPNPQIVVNDQGKIANDNTLAHELAHKWYFEQIPEKRRNEWSNDWGTVVDPDTLYISDLRANSPEGANAATESYAHFAEGGPQDIPEKYRDYYYPGLYREDIPLPMREEEAVQPYDPERSAELRRKYFSPQRWVKEQDAPYGYYADGSPVQGRLPYPAQWSPPQWPSLAEYDRLGYKG